MHATATSTHDLAEALARFLGQVMRGREGDVFELVEELGVTITQVKALQILAHCDEELPVKELADRLSLSLPSGSRAADALLRRGWVERREDETDRRMRRISITPAGREIAERFATARMAGLEEFAGSLTDAQRSTLYAALSKIG